MVFLTRYRFALANSPACGSCYTKPRSISAQPQSKEREMMPTRPTGRRRLLLVVLVLLSALSAAPAADQPQWGERFSRNMVSGETGLPDRFDPKTGENIKWSVALGSQCWATPVVAGGRVLIGTNNSQRRDPETPGRPRRADVL